MEEHIFLQNENLLITSTRLVLDNKTIAMSAVCSVELDREEIKPPWLALGLTGLGLLSILFSKYPDIGWVLLLFGLSASILRWIGKRKEAVIIELNSGEKEVITNEENHDLNAILESINEVIVFRG